MPLRGLRAGTLDRRITIQADEGAQDKGRWVPDWQNLHVNIAAGFTPLSASEAFRSDQRLAKESGTFTVRWRSDWAPDPKLHRIVYHGKEWGITGVVELGRRDGWDLMAEVRGTVGGG